MTLIELLVVLFILSAVSDAIFSLLYAGLKVYWKGDLATQVQQGTRVSVDRMVRDLQQAETIVTGQTETVGSLTVAFNTSCAAGSPQISVQLPHLGSIALADGTTIYGTDPNASGTVPYPGSYVSYYLAATQGNSTSAPAPNSTGPYLIRASYDLVANTITFGAVAGNVTALSLSSSGGCPGVSTQEFTMTLTANQQAAGQNVSSRTIVTSDVKLRN